MMKTIIQPSKEEWSGLTKRPTIKNEALTERVQSILRDVRKNGDRALFNYSRTIDQVELESLLVTPEEIRAGIENVPQGLKDAIELAYQNIYAFHASQLESEKKIETAQGITCWRKPVPIEKVGLYIPGGSAPLFSTILMLGIPAKIAGCKEIILCTPPDANKSIHPAILYAAHRLGISKIHKVGGAQAVAAMAYGTETIPGVFKIFGPGNQYVTKAKELVQIDGVAIDMPAGPSEVLVIADSTCKPEFVAADLLSQAEHGADSQVMLLTNHQAVLHECVKEVTKQVQFLPRKEIAQKALAASKAIALESIEACISFSNLYAPEHLILASESASLWTDEITNAGSVFIGNYSCESAGDYASGTNHTLPTNGFAKNYSGVSLDSFVKKITFQALTKEGIQRIGRAIEVMAEAEELWGHKNAVTIRLKSLNHD
jgi:histidinol dehydrogenase